MPSTSGVDDLEEEFEHFDDFTLSSSWERFISEIEAICRQWLADGTKNLLGICKEVQDRGYASSNGRKELHCGATVYMLCPNKDRGEAALIKIHSTIGNKNVYSEVYNVSSVSDARSFPSRFCSKAVHVRVMVNNAGLLETNRVHRTEGSRCHHALRKPLLTLCYHRNSAGMYTAPLTTDLQCMRN